MRWQYDLISYNTDHYDEGMIAARLNEYGAAGWEAISMILLPNGWTRVLFKRQVPR